MEKVIPFIVTDSYICTSDDRNNNIGGMEDKNGSGYLKNVSKMQTVYSIIQMSLTGETAI
jgi:hypothetical protein